MGSIVQKIKNRIEKVEYRNNKKKCTDKITVGLPDKATENERFVPSDKRLLRQRAERSCDLGKVNIKMHNV